MKAIRARILQTYPQAEEFIDTLWPKKEPVLQIKIKGEAFVSLYQIQGEIRFLDIRDMPILPMLRVVH